MSQHDANCNTALFSRGHLEKAPKGTSWWAEPKPREAFMAEASDRSAEMSRKPEAKHVSKMVIGFLR